MAPVTYGQLEQCLSEVKHAWSSQKHVQSSDSRYLLFLHAAHQSVKILLGLQHMAGWDNMFSTGKRHD
jgi:hypothetical protein